MSNITIHFELSHKPLKDGSFRVRCRITINRKPARLNTPFIVQSPSEFNEAKECFVKNKSANAHLNIMRGELQTLYGKLMHENPSAATIKQRYTNTFHSKAGIMNVIDEFIAYKNADPDIKPRSKLMLEYRLKHFQNFLESQHMSKRKASEMVLADIQAYEVYLQGIRKANGEPLRRRVDMHKAAQSIFNWADEKGYIQSNPYKYFKKPKPKPLQRKEHLTIPELHLLINADTRELNPHQKYYLTLFLFAVAIGGVAIADLQGLKPEHIKERAGRLWLVKPRQKVENSTGAILETPFSNLAKELYERIMQRRRAKEAKNGVLISMIDTTYRISVNQAVKILGIDKHITPHCVRHTFGAAMSMIGQESKISKAMMGHKQGDTLHEHYVEVHDVEKIIAMDKLAEAILKGEGTMKHL